MKEYTPEQAALLVADGWTVHQPNPDHPAVWTHPVRGKKIKDTLRVAPIPPIGGVAETAANIINDPAVIHDIAQDMVGQGETARLALEAAEAEVLAVRGSNDAPGFDACVKAVLDEQKPRRDHEHRIIKD